MGDMQQLSTTGVIVVAVCSLLTVLIQNAWHYKTQKMLKSTHREVAVNGGKNNPRTLNDKVGIVMTTTMKMLADLTQVSEKQDDLAAEQAKLAEGQAALAEAQRASSVRQEQRQDQANARMDAHLTQSAQMDQRLIELETLVRSSRQ